jgi:hypothetical protein
VELHQQAAQQDVEIMNLQHVQEDVHHNHQHLFHQQIHAIVKLLQLENVEIKELLLKQDVEIMKLQHVKQDVHHHQIHVIAKQQQ